MRRALGLAFFVLLAPAVQAQIIETVAGGVPGPTPALDVALGSPYSVAIDANGNLYMALLTLPSLGGAHQSFPSLSGLFRGIPRRAEAFFGAPDASGGQCRPGSGGHKPPILRKARAIAGWAEWKPNARRCSKRIRVLADSTRALLRP